MAGEGIMGFFGKKDEVIKKREPVNPALDNTSPDDVLALATKQRDTACDYWTPNWELARDDIRFRRGFHWPEKILKERQEDGRPCLVINRIPAFLRQVVGDQRQNRPGMKVRPADDVADPLTAEIIEGLIRNAEYISKGKTIQDAAFSQSTGNGFGYMRIVTEYSAKDAFTQDMKFKRVFNPFSVILDPAGTEMDHSDGMFAFVDNWMNRDEYKERFPGKPIVDVNSQVVYRHPWHRGEDDVLVSEYYRRVSIKKRYGLTERDEVIDLDKMKDEIAGEEGAQYILDQETGEPTRIVKTREGEEFKVLRYLLSGADVLEGPQLWPSQWIPIVPVWGEELCTEDGRKELNSVIRFGKDPARMYDYFRSAATEIIALAPKAPYIITAKQLGNHHKMWEQANTTNSPILVYEHDQKAPPPQRQPPPQASSAILAEAQAAEHDQKSTIGIFDPSLGEKSNETSGRAIIARQKKSDVSTYTWMDNLSIAYAHCGRIMLDLIPVIYDTARVVRIRGRDDKDTQVKINQEYDKEPTKEGQAIEKVLHDMTVGRYDIVIETGPSYATQRMEAASSMIEFAQALPGSAEIIGDLIAKNMDWKGADEIAKRLKKTLPPGVVEPDEGEQAPPQQPPSPQEQLEKQKLALEEQKLKLEFEKLKVEIMRIPADLEKPMSPEEVKQLVIQTLEGMEGDIRQQ